MMIAADIAHDGKSKVERYGWTVQDVPGELQYISKLDLKADDAYQRESARQKVLALAKEWSWLACGALIVAKRLNTFGGSFGPDYFIVDGGHRHQAALRRADIDKLPCLVFASTGLAQEAQAYLRANENRRPMYVVEKFKALLSVGNEDALLVQRLISESGRTFSSGSGASTVGCLSAMMRSAKNNRGELVRIWPVIVECAKGQPIIDRLVQGLIYLESKMPDGDSLSSPRWRKRIISLGASELVDGAARAQAYHVRGGAKVYAEGMLKSINRGLHSRLQIEGLS